MNNKFKKYVLALVLVPGLVLAAPPLQVRKLAAATGLTVSEVQMVLGARTPHPEYITSYERSRHRMEQALGQERYQELMAGHEITLDNGDRVAIVIK